MEELVAVFLCSEKPVRKGWFSGLVGGERLVCIEFAVQVLLDRSRLSIHYACKVVPLFGSGSPGGTNGDRGSSGCVPRVDRTVDPERQSLVSQYSGSHGDGKEGTQGSGSHSVTLTVPSLIVYDHFVCSEGSILIQVQPEDAAVVAAGAEGDFTCGNCSGSPYFKLPSPKSADPVCAGLTARASIDGGAVEVQHLVQVMFRNEVRSGNEAISRIDWIDVTVVEVLAAPVEQAFLDTPGKKVSLVYVRGIDDVEEVVIGFGISALDHSGLYPFSTGTFVPADCKIILDLIRNGCGLEPRGYRVVSFANV